MASPSSRAVRTEAEKAARQTLAARASLIGDLAAAAHDLQQAEGHLAQAREQHANAYQVAIDGGWTAAELKSLRYTAPESPSHPRASPRRHAVRPESSRATGTGAANDTPEA